MSNQESNLKGRGVGEVTKQKVIELKATGLFTNEKIAHYLNITEIAVERALRVDLCNFTEAEVKIVTAALGYLRGRKDNNFHGTREFDQIILATNEVDADQLKALHERVVAYGLKTE